MLLYAPTSHIEHRGDTLGGVCLTIEITSPMPEIIRVKTFHNKGALDHGPKFELNLGEGCPLDVKDSESTIEIHSGKAGLLIDKKKWKIN